MQHSPTTVAPARNEQPANGETARIVEQLGRLHDGGAWHGPSVAEALDGLSAEDATRRPIGAAHSAWEIVHHLRVTLDQVRGHLTGEAAADEAAWVPATEADDAAWRRALETLRVSQRALREAATRLPAAHPHWEELLGILQHDAYHAGQISLLRKGDGALAALAAPGRSSEVPESADLYGWLVGSWDLDVLHYWTDVKGRGLKGEAHFAWALEGRAVQDVWIMPRRSERTAAMDRAFNTYGTTLRVFDRAIQAWRVTWINPVTGARAELVGRRVGEDVVQVGAHRDGTPIRWSFTEITKDSFRWLGEALAADGRTWEVQGEFRGRRLR